MIEVEKKFQPSDKQLKNILIGAEFLGEVVLEDTYYDYPDYRFFKNKTYFRNRNGSFELKIGKSHGVSEEIEVKKDIEQYFGTNNLEEFIKKNLVVITEYDTNRRKYKKEDFNIDVDETSFGYKILEIELMVEKEEHIEEAENKIINLAKKYNFEIKKVSPKRKEYFRLLKPEVYKKLYGKKN